MSYSFKDGIYKIEGYDKEKPFCSFLPGIAGILGKPLWCYYVNRGQVVSSFGVKDKGSPILEFSPGSIAYQKVSLDGFRTFFKVNGKYVEPFGILNPNNSKRDMLINESSVGIKEINEELGYSIDVSYYGLPNENVAGLVRMVKITNISNHPIEIEVLDGLTSILPKGLTNSAYKEVGNLMRSWMDVLNLENKVAFYKLRASSSDEAEVSKIEDGNFFLSYVDGNLADPVVDAKTIFGYDESFQVPVKFLEGNDYDNLNQITANKVACGFVHSKKVLNPGESLTINSLYGYVEDVHIINRKLPEFDQNYFINKKNEAYSIIRNLTNDIDTKTSNVIFDEYCRQSYLDNFIRGGYPTLLDDGKDGVVYYLYSRKHGDLERDYNWFIISPEYYSQGNGNYRDANQNRRNDILFKNYVNEYNIKQFMDLVQIDGYNPLSVNGVTFNICNDLKDEVINTIFKYNDVDFGYMLDKFTPGSVYNYIDKIDRSKLNMNASEALKYVLGLATYDYEANFGEGYWSDHFAYNLDLIQNYLKIYPDKKEYLLFEDLDYKYFQSPITVLPRSEKYVLNKENQVRQYGAINHHDKSKCEKLGINIYATNWLKTELGYVYKTSLFEKLLSLALIKFLNLDPYGIGLEMEAEKPGWNDAMNGVPGLLGSGVSETLELYRIVKFLSESLDFGSVEILEEVSDLADEIDKLLNLDLSDFEYWNKSATIKEVYRAKTDITISGKLNYIEARFLKELLEKMLIKLDESINKAIELGNGILPTYLIYNVTKYEKVLDNGNEVLSHYGLPKVKPLEFEVRPLPYFLESPARAYKILDKSTIKEMHNKVKETELYDKKLGIYRTSIDIDPENLEIGRIRAFTKGWLERESCFLHMTYKYLLGLLYGGLYEEFFNELKTNLVCFMDPKVYGRSVLENSSFIATSCNPDPETHGKGYVSRLTGANVEFLSMWQYMMFGKSVFKMDDGKLIAEFKPVLPGYLFDDNNEISAMFMSKTKVTYKNNSRKDTYNCIVEKMIIDGLEINSNKLSDDLVVKLRDGSFENITIILK